MRYLITKSVKQKINKANKQITKSALRALDIKVDEYLDKLIKQWNGKSKRITAELVNLIKL